MKRSWVEIDEARLAANYRVVCEAAGADTDVLVVVKANAYGHGLERCAVALARADAPWLGVADAAEGASARRALETVGIGRQTVNILTLYGVLPGDVSAIVEHGLTPVVWTKEHVELLRGTSKRIHIEVETGMSRQGVRPGAALEELLAAIAGAGLELDGVMTHFHSAEIAGSERVREQKRKFEAAVGQLRGKRLQPRWIHAGSSSSVDVDGDAAWLEGLAKGIGARAMVRSGIALYGYCLPVASEGADASPRVNAARADETKSLIRGKLKPVMKWKTRVLDVREVAAGETIGYNATFTAKKAMRVALLPVGYADGLRRELSGTDERAGGWVMVRAADGAERRAPIVGRISMDLTTVDVTGTGGISVGDEVVLLGDGVTADDHARIAHTISYEIVCGVRA